MATVVGTLLVVLFGTLATGLWIGLTLLLTSLLLIFIFRNIPIDLLLSQYTFNILTTPDLVALPLFIVMGEFLFRTRLSRSLFDGLAPWAGLLPGRLLHVNILGCSIFAAVSGSSAATAQVVGRISITELERRGYKHGIVVGSLAGAGTLGFLIPPSMIMIIYAVLAEESVLHMFAAGLLPGILLAMLFMAWIMIHTYFKPDLVPEEERAMRHVPMMHRIAALKELAPTGFLILAVLGSMYGGLASPSEAAAVGVVGAVIIAAAQKELNLTTIRSVALGSVQTCSMIGLIVIGASILGNVAALLGIPRAAVEFVSQIDLAPYTLIAALVVIYLVLGCFLDGFSIIALTLPVVAPLVAAAGFDKVWFGIFLVIVVEMSQITPPVGFNLFVIQGLTGDSISKIARYATPFLLIMVGFAVLLAVFPQIAKFLPELIYG